MPSKSDQIKLNDIQVLCVQTVGVENSAKAFIDLEKKIGSLKGRKFYGTLIGKPTTGIYRACVEARPEESAVSLGLDTWTIPGGIYLKAKMADWMGKEMEIGPMFAQMAENHKVDETRPYIEFYKSTRELVFLLPLLP
jgi:hypothetical protein